MRDILPVVRHILLCDELQRNETTPHKFDILGLTHWINPPDDPDRPRQVDSLRVFLVLTEVYRSGSGQVVVTEADTGYEVYRGSPHKIVAPHSPLHLVPCFIRTNPLVFPAGGLFWVEFRYNNKELAREPLLVR